MKEKKGFTLVELLAVIVILGVLISAAVVSYNKFIDSSKSKSYLNSAMIFVSSIESNELINENSKDAYYLVNDDYLKDFIESGYYPSDGVVVVRNKKVIQAKLCYDERESLEYFEGKYTIHKSDVYCNYIDDALESGIPNKINEDKLNDDTRIVGLFYEDKNLAALRDNIRNSTDEEFIAENGDVPSGYVLYKYDFDDENIASSNVQKGNVQKVKVNVDNNIDKSYFNLHDSNLSSGTKNQGNLGICWSFSAVGSIESNMLVNNGTAPNFSERHLDYFNSNDGVVSLNTNPYGERNLGSGESKENVSDMLQTGMTILLENQFSSTLLKNKRVAASIFSGKNEYYVKSLRLTPGYISDYVRNHIDNFVKDMKEELLLNGAIDVSFCSKLMKFNNETRSYEVVSNKEIVELDQCGSHAVNIVGWDDEYEYKDDNGNTKYGAWIAHNSWGIKIEYFYIAYDYEFLYKVSHLSIEKVEKKDWDNSYDFTNNLKSLTFDDRENGISYLNTYLNKVDNKEEYINKMAIKSYSSKNHTFYIFEVEDYNDEVDAESNCLFSSLNKIDISNNEIYSLSGKKIGFVYEYKSKEDYGYEVVDLNNKFVFSKDICIMQKNNNNDRLTIFTKNNSSVTKKIESKIVSQSGYNVKIDSVVSGFNSGISLSVDVYDDNGTKVTSKFKIEDKFVVNNVAHIKLTIPDVKNNYKVKIYNGSVESYVLIEGLSKNSPFGCQVLAKGSFINIGEFKYSFTVANNYSMSLKSGETTNLEFSCSNPIKSISYSPRGVNIFHRVYVSKKECTDSNVCILTLKARKSLLKNSKDVTVDITLYDDFDHKIKFPVYVTWEK